jgi:hypothetical protein
MSRYSMLRVRISLGVLTITVGVETLCHEALLDPEFAAYDDQTGEDVEPQLIDADLFATEILDALKREDEDGSTLVHRCLDAARREAIEQGAEGMRSGSDLMDERRRARA